MAKPARRKTMTLRLPMFLAVTLILASHAALASPPTNTDEVRALAASRMPSSPPRLAQSPSVISTNTDEVRALVASLAPASPALSTGSASLIATNTDEVRALFGRAPATQVVRSSVSAAAAESSRGDSRTVACPHSCPCHQG
jgi:hypothetical protein